MRNSVIPNVIFGTLPAYFWLLLCLAFPISADEILLRDGSRLVGKVIRMEGAILEFETKSVGMVKVTWAEVKRLHADEPVTVMLEDTQTLQAFTILNKDESISLRKVDDIQPVEIEYSELAYINPDPEQSEVEMQWTGIINFDLESKQGNTDSDEFYSDMQMKFRRHNSRFSIEGEYEKDKNDGDLTEENWDVANQYDYFISKKLFYGAVLLLEHDRFQDLNLRMGIGPHIGYQFFESSQMNFSINAGILHVDENFYEAEDDSYEAIGWRTYFDRFIVPNRIQFYHRHNALQDISDIDNLRFNSWTGFRFPIYKGLVASTEAQIEYNKDVPDDVEKTDTTYRVKLGYGW